MPELRLNLQTYAALSFKHETSGAVLSPDEKYLAAYHSNKISIWEMSALESGEAVLITPSGIIHDLAFSPDGKILAAATDESQVVLWSFPAGQRLAVLDGDLNRQGFFKNLFGYFHNQVVFSPDGNYLASQDNCARPLLWETRSFTLCKHLDDPIFDSQYHTMAFSPDCHMLVVGHDHSVVLYDVYRGVKIEDFGTIAECLAFHHNKKQIAVGLHNKITLFDPSRPDVVLNTKKDDRVIAISNIVFSPTGDFLLAVGRSANPAIKGRVLYGWSLASGEIISRILPDCLAAVCGDSNTAPGKRLQLISSDKIMLW